MVGLLIVLGIFFVPAFIGWIVEQIKTALEQERSRRRDDIAEAIFEENGLTEDDFQQVDKEFEHLRLSIPSRLERRQFTELEMPSFRRSRNGQICPTCHSGILLPRRGPYGQFLGCSNYPNCTGKKPINWVDKSAKDKFKKQFEDQFTQDLKKAYN